MSDNEWFPGPTIIIVLVLNLWFVTLLFHKLPFLEWSDPIITKKFWLWYFLWWCIMPYELYKNSRANLANTEPNV